MQFRADINSLRALALISVLIFHFFPDTLPSGFSGVDVFFVISGYLMTSIIFRGVDNKRFSLAYFYTARFNRIVPPLLFMCIVCLILGFFFLASIDYKVISRDVVTSLVFVSNIFFSQRRGYFESGDNFLLHTWSLSVEWQFYIIYPILIIFALKFFNLGTVKRIIIVTFLSSLSYSGYLSSVSPEQSYFLLTTRCWEMLLGGICYFSPSIKKIRLNKLLNYIGIIMVLLSFFIFDKSTTWPGLNALIPTLGTFLIIFSHQNTFITNNRVIQFIGLSSYSTYIWHWPVSVTISYFGFSSVFSFWGVGLSLLLGIISYELVEKRFRNALSLKLTLIVTLILMSMTLAYSLFVYKTSGLSFRDNLYKNSLIQGGTDDEHSIKEGVINFGEDDIDYILVGDSYASHYTRGIINSGDNVKTSWYATCISFPNVINQRKGYYPGWKESCASNYQVTLGSPVPIIISNFWLRPSKNVFECVNGACELTGDYIVDLDNHLGRLIEKIGVDKKIYIVGQLPIPKDKQIIKCVKRNLLLAINDNCGEFSSPRSSVVEVNEVLKKVSQKYANVDFIDLSKHICDDKRCRYTLNGNSLFSTDGEHLSGFGSEFFWGLLIREIEKG